MRGTHYGYRSRKALLPCVEVTECVAGSHLEPPEVVNRVYGLTWSHAIARALKWMRKNGDPR